MPHPLNRYTISDLDERPQQPSDLLRVAHDAFVGCQLVPEIITLEQKPLRLEAKEGLLEARPFLLDDPTTVN